MMWKECFQECRILGYSLVAAYSESAKKLCKCIIKYGIPFLTFDYGVSYYRRHVENSEIETQNSISRVKVPVFKNIGQVFKKIGFGFHNVEGSRWKGFLFGSAADNYWIDGHAYKISPDLTKEILEATQELHSMCLEATDFAISDDEILMKVFEIPADVIPAIRESWKQRQPDLLARYDFLLDEQGKLRFLECNGDTPSLIIESGPAQREWASFQDLPQFNVLEKNIIKSFKKISAKYSVDELVFFQNQNFEDTCTAKFMTQLLKENAPEIHLQEESIVKITDRLRESLNMNKKQLFWRQYPLEWLTSEDAHEILVNPKFISESSNTTMIEPAWKLLMSNKAMSVLLGAMYPGSPYLIDSQLNPFEKNIDQVSKQKYGRNDEGIFVLRHLYSQKNIEKEYNFLKQSYFGHENSPIFQKLIPSRSHQGRFITLSSWMISGEMSGIAVREDLNLINGSGSSMAPYFINSEINHSPINIEIRESSSQANIIKSLYPNRKLSSNIPSITFSNSQSESAQVELSQVKAALLAQLKQNGRKIEETKLLVKQLDNSRRSYKMIGYCIDSLKDIFKKITNYFNTKRDPAGSTGRRNTSIS